MAIVKLRNYNDNTAFVGYDLEARRVCKLDANAPIGGAFKKIGSNDYWGFVDTKFRDMDADDFFFFHNATIYNFEDFSVSTTSNYFSSDKAEFTVTVDGQEQESLAYSRFDSFDPTGWLNEGELDIFVIINREVKKLRQPMVM